MSQVAEAAKLRSVRVDLPEDAYSLLRKVAAEHGQSMASYARVSFEQHVRDEAKRLGLKA